MGQLSALRRGSIKRLLPGGTAGTGPQKGSSEARRQTLAAKAQGSFEGRPESFHASGTGVVLHWGQSLVFSGDRDGETNPTSWGNHGAAQDGGSSQTLGVCRKGVKPRRS